MIFDSGTFDDDLIEDFLPHYTIDTIIQEMNRPASYNLDTTFGSIVRKPYFLDSIIRKPFTNYSMDAVVVMDKQDPRFVESIINAVLISHGRVLEKLSSAIAMMELRMQLPYATGDDLNQYWSKILALRRRHGESDEDYRSRLIVRLSIMKSSGTRPECEFILNSLLGMNEAVELKSYWPADVQLNWKSYTAMRRGEDRYSLVAETMNQMLAAGVSWSTSFPYKVYDLDTRLIGVHPVEYLIETAVSRPKWGMYLVRTDVFNTGNFMEELDAVIVTDHFTQYLHDVRVSATVQTSAQLAVNVSEPHPASYLIEGVIKQRLSKQYSNDGLLEKTVPRIYRTDGMVERPRRGFYMMATEVV